MLVDREDAIGPKCEEQLHIDEIDDCFMFVSCTTCGHDMQVESDAFGDGCINTSGPCSARQKDSTLMTCFSEVNHGPE